MGPQQKDLIIMYYEIKRFRDQEKFSIQRIADYLGLNFRTVKKYLEMEEDEFNNYLESIGGRPFKLASYKQFIFEYLDEYPDTPAAVLHDKLKERFSTFPEVAPKTVYNYVQRVRSEFNISKVTRSERQYSAVPDLDMGEQAQVDFGEKRLRTSKGGWQKVYFFIMLLCHSRYKFVIFRDTSFNSQSAIESHEMAFEFFRGIPREIVYDQDAVFIHRENLGDYILADIFDRYRLSRPFKIYFCRPGDPESKGKVENVVKYVKQNFLYNRIYSNLDNLNQEALAWMNRTGNMMKHNTTCKVPYSLWCEEQKYLLPWQPLFIAPKDKGHKVIKTNVIKYRGNTYCLPLGTYKNDDTMVYVSESGNQLIIKDENQKTVITHCIPEGKGQTVINSSSRRNPSVRVNDLRAQLREFFTFSSDIDTFISGVEKLYPRYVRDQLSALLVICEKHGKIKSEIALEFCVGNHIFSSNDFRAVIEGQSSENHHPEPPLKIKPLGGSKIQLIANLEPERSDIKEYESIFNQTPDKNEPVHTTN